MRRRGQGRRGECVWGVVAGIREESAPPKKVAPFLCDAFRLLSFQVNRRGNFLSACGVDEMWVSRVQFVFGGRMNKSRHAPLINRTGLTREVVTTRARKIRVVSLGVAGRRFASALN